MEEEYKEDHFVHTQCGVLEGFLGLEITAFTSLSPGFNCEGCLYVAVLGQPEY